MRKVEAEILIQSSPARAIDAFMKPRHLKGWWSVEKCLVEPKKGGVYTLAWQVSEKGFGYVSTGAVEIFKPDRLLKVNNFVYMNPGKPLLGPMSLTVKAEAKEGGTLPSVCQDGYKEGEVWDWYYAAVSQAWPEVLKGLKEYLEKL